MPDLNATDNPPGLATLVGGLLEDTQRLVRQEVALARREIGEELTKTRDGAAFMAAAVVLFAPVGLLFAFTLVKLLQDFLLPNQEWACFAIITALFAVGGGLLLWAGMAKLQQVNLLPRQTVDSLREDVHAVTTAVAPDRSPNNNLLRQR